MQTIYIILLSFALIIVLVYPVTKLISKAWHSQKLKEIEKKLLKGD